MHDFGKQDTYTGGGSAEGLTGEHNSHIRLSKQTDIQLTRSIRAIEKQIILHKQKIENPRLYVSEWDSRNHWYQSGIVSKWEKEILTFEKDVKVGLEIARERGLL